jgi:7-cyano-7-deazaguanine synthase
MGNGIIMLYSGGADSLLMLKFALMGGKTVHALLIDYGQKHVEELTFAKRHLEEHRVTYQTISIEGLNVDSGLTGGLTEARWDNVHAMNVPARNTIFLGLAMSVAENMGFDEVWYGPDYSDRINLFPDCYQEYVVAMNKVAEISGVKPIKIVAPLLGMSKELIKDILKNIWSVKEEDMHSGYDHPAMDEFPTLSDDDFPPCCDDDLVLEFDENEGPAWEGLEEDESMDIVVELNDVVPDCEDNPGPIGKVY